MTPERWRQVTKIFHAALAHDESQRAGYLDGTCGADRDLRTEVDAMLAAHAADADFGGIALDISTIRTPGLAAHAVIGAYRIDSLIGSGGMGEVYRATDTNLKRQVAIKVLPDLLASDAERLARFQREAEVLAQLNHPNIAAIYGLERSGDVPALVMELVEGPTLADRIAERPIPVDEALPIAKQIAEALEAAHERGIIHRDLKPANIKVRPDGTVKVLDFGLAKALEPAAAPVRDATISPTITSPAPITGVDVLLGTAAYISPEQAKGKPADQRSDIWAFGCVLYEMLAGKRAFEGETVSETLAEVMKSEPRWTALPPETPSALRNVIRRCLVKDPRQRVRDIGDARLALEGAFETPATVEAPVVPLHLWKRPLPLTGAAVTVILLTAVGILMLTRPSLPQVARFVMTPSGATAITMSGFGGSDLAISPDGTRLVYVGANGTLVLRALDQLAPTPFGGLGEPNAPFFSPDGKWIGYFNGNRALMKIASTGGPPEMVAPIITGSAAGASWGVDDTIIVATKGASKGLFRVAAGGGEPAVLTMPKRDRGEVDHVFPEVLPGGRAVLFTILNDGIDSAQVAVLDLTTREQKVLIDGGSGAHYAPTGHLVYRVPGALRAVGFDLDRLEVLGTPVPVLEPIMATGSVVNLSISSGGTLVYVRGAVQPPSPPMPLQTLVWVDRQGLEDPVNAPSLRYRYPRISPDGARVAVDAVSDIWIWDLTRKTQTRFTFDPKLDQYPVWTPDGRRLLFRSERSGPPNIFWQAADGTGAVNRLTESPNEQTPYAVSPDGTRLVFREDVRATGQDLKVLSLQGERQAEPLVQTPFDERNGEISSDGRWIAYQSNESGQDEVYVRPFPEVNSGRWQISTGGGRTPLWSRSGKELFYQTPDGAVFGVTVEVGHGANFRAGTPAKLVEGRYYVGGGTSSPGRTYDVSPDGRRFLMVKAVSTDVTSAPREIVVVENWSEELKRLVPTK